MTETLWAVRSDKGYLLPDTFDYREESVIERFMAKFPGGSWKEVSRLHGLQVVQVECRVLGERHAQAQE